MPHRVYAHDCCPDAPYRKPGKPDCPHCGTPGTPAGWGLSVVEHWGQAERAWGLGAIGSHRPLADELLGPFWRRCRSCGASGYVGDEGPETCPDCGGRGGVWEGDEDEIRAAHSAVIEAYPGAGRLGSIVVRPHGLDR